MNWYQIIAGLVFIMIKLEIVTTHVNKAFMFRPNFLKLIEKIMVGFKRNKLITIGFQKSWPQQPPPEKVLKSVRNLIFEDPFHKNGPVLVILVPGMIQPSEFRIR